MSSEGTPNDESSDRAHRPKLQTDPEDREAIGQARNALFGHADPLRIGRYLYRGKLGSGGMGIVYKAHDERLNRDVAIKALRAGQSPARFEREASALAKLSHPNVVAIYEIERFEEFRGLGIVMELIEGLTLDVWIASKRRKPSEIVNKLCAAGRGLAAVHSVGLVHRDFKPQNVMIRTEDGRVVVMDLGVATDRSAGTSSTQETRDPAGEATLPHAQIGTRAYMAPEQIRGQAVDPRTDQFAFCFVFWQCLFGEPPFDVADENRDRVRRPSDASRAPKWLRRVLERGLAADRATRWPSMNALLAELQDDPTRRRRIGFSVIGVAILSTAAVVALSYETARERERAIEACETESLGLSEEWNAATRADIQVAFVATGHPIAETTWEHAAELLDTYDATWRASRARACMEARVDGTRSEASYQRVAQCLDRRRRGVATLLKLWRTPNATMVPLTVSTVAQLDPLAQCEDERWMDLEPIPEDADAAQVAALKTDLDRTASLLLAGEAAHAVEDAESHLVRARDLNWMPLLADAQLGLGRAEREAGDYAAAARSLRAAYVSAVTGGHEVAAFHAARMLTDIVGSRLMQFEVSEGWSNIALAHLRRARLEGTMFEAQLLSTDGNVARSRGDYESAVENHRRALVINEAILGGQHYYVAAGYGNLGNATSAMGMHAEAIGYYQKCIDLKIALLGPSHPNLMTSYANMGIARVEMGDTVGGLGSYRMALEIGERSLGKDHPDLVYPLSNAAGVYMGLGEYAESLDLYQRALEIAKHRYGAEHPTTCVLEMSIAIIGVSQEHYQEAAASLRPVVVCLEKALGSEHPHLAMALKQLGRCEFEMGEDEEAVAMLERSLAIYSKSSGDPKHLASAKFQLARALWVRGDRGRARDLAIAALEYLRTDEAVDLEEELAAVELWIEGHDSPGDTNSNKYSR